ncbi:MAG: hypothetical protein WDN29_16275 [Methylovirgula sp.]
MGTIYARVVHSPGATLPAYHDFQSGFEASESDIETKLESAVRDVVKDV